MKWKSLYMPKSIEMDESTSTDTYGRFVVQPLERGFGTTLGNALRRTLLSSIQGAAIRAIRLEGAHHEFTTIPGVMEDVPEIVLNLKEVCVKLHADSEKTISVEKQGPRDLTAADLQVDSEVEIVNPDFHIATLGEDGRLKMEIYIGSGRGYVFAEDNRLPDQPLGTIAMDSLFSPIRKVRYEVDSARVGRRTDYDRLTIEIWTNGTIRPDDALSFAAKVVRDHLDLFIQFEEEPEEEPEEEEEIDHEAERIRALLRMPVEELELSVRSANCLRAAGILTLIDLVQKTEQDMLKYRNFGRKSLHELMTTLADLGLGFGVDVTPYMSPDEIEKEVYEEAYEDDGEVDKEQPEEIDRS